MKTVLCILEIPKLVSMAGKYGGGVGWDRWCGERLVRDEVRVSVGSVNVGSW